MEVQGCNADGLVYTWPYVEHDTLTTSLDCSHDGRTRQEFKDDCDINLILNHYEDTGAWKSFNRQAPTYMDLSDVPDLATAMTVMEQARVAFMTLTARQRAEFDNDPIKFVAFCEQKENIDKLREWGLARPLPPAEQPIKVEITNPPAQGGEEKKPA